MLTFTKARATTISVVDAYFKAHMIFRTISTSTVVVSHQLLQKRISVSPQIRPSYNQRTRKDVFIFLKMTLSMLQNEKLTLSIQN